MRPLILTHTDPDGWLAGAIALDELVGSRTPDDHLRSEAPEIRYCTYGMPFLVADVAGREVYVLDFSWPPADMASLALAAGRLVWIDHYPEPVRTHEQVNELIRTSEGGANATFILDTSRCGAWLTWEFFNQPLVPGAPPLPRPLIVDYIDDHDRWQHKLQATKPVIAALKTLCAQERSEWKGWIELLDLDLGQEAACLRWLERTGEILLQAEAERVAAACKRAIRTMIDGHTCLCVNAAGDASEIGDALDADAEIGWVWWVDVGSSGAPVVRNSLRSRPVDVGAICKLRGGGGHRLAAGWTGREALDLLR